jgi:cell shape-determining protein MreC
MLLTRTFKDYNSYAKENKQLEEKLEKMKAEEAEEIALKKMEEQIAETA